VLLTIKDTLERGRYLLDTSFSWEISGFVMARFG